MKKKLFLLFLLIVSGLQVQAQKGSSVFQKDSADVAAAVERLRLALISGNKNELEAVFTSDLTYGHSGGQMENKTQTIDALVTKRSDFVSISLTNQSITVQGDIAVVRHFLTADTNDGGKPGHVHLGVVLVLKKQHNSWLVMARRSFRIPE